MEYFLKPHIWLFYQTGSNSSPLVRCRLETSLCGPYLLPILLTAPQKTLFSHDVACLHFAQTIWERTDCSLCAVRARLCCDCRAYLGCWCNQGLLSVVCLLQACIYVHGIAVYGYLLALISHTSWSKGTERCAEAKIWVTAMACREKTLTKQAPK